MITDLLLTLIRWARFDFRGLRNVEVLWMDGDKMIWKTTRIRDTQEGDVLRIEDLPGCFVSVRPPEIAWTRGRWSVMTVTEEEYAQIQSENIDTQELEVNPELPIRNP